MFLKVLESNPAFYATWIVLVIVSIVLHELAHGVVAIRQGDRTPIETGHMTWNPLVHMGAFSLILLAVLGLGFGAMPVRPDRFRGRFGRAAVAFAGPATNLLLAAIGVVSAGLLVRFGLIAPPNGVLFFEEFRVANVLLLAATLNLALCVFNLLPIPPLDGSTVLADFWPAWRRWTSNPDLAPFFQAGFLLVFFFGGPLFYRSYSVAVTTFARLAGFA